MEFRKKFESCYKKSFNGCWLWEKGLNSGYGLITYKNKQTRAHRVSWIINKGPIPAGIWVLHKCDVRKCVNPNHLYLGTHADNVRDVCERKRYSVRLGSKHPRAKLKEEDVRQIRIRKLSGEKVTDLAVEYGVAKTTICSATTNNKHSNWKHLR